MSDKKRAECLKNGFYQHVRINDVHEMVGLLDSGADVCIVKEKCARERGLIITPWRESLSAYGDLSHIATVGRVIMTLQVGSARVEEVDCLVVSDSVRGPDLLIGAPFLSNHTVKWTVRGGQVTVEEDADVTELPLVEESREILQVVRSSDELPRDEIHLGEDVSEEEADAIVRVIHEHRECFSQNLQELGCTNVMEVEIHDSDEPVRMKPYMVSTADRSEIRKIVEEWREAGIVRETNSDYASPVLLVPKPNGEKRLVVDFRSLNKQTRVTNFPIPNIEEQFKTLSGNTLFTTLDLANGYLQVPLAEASKRKTAIITPDTTAEFNRLCFGLKNAPFEFCRLMNRVLGDLNGSDLVYYLDDILIPTKSVNELLQKLKIVFTRFKSAGLTLKLAKCRFAMSTVSFLGFEVCGDGIRPGIGKTDAIRQFARPRNVHETRRFLGLTGFFRRFIKEYAVKTRPLTELTRKDKTFLWGEDEERSFENLKIELTQRPILQAYNAAAYTELHTDASADGLAAMLMQADVQGQMRLVHCISKKTTDAERKYHSSRLELLAVVWSVERFRTYLLGMEFVIVTDCQALIYLHEKKTLKPQIARWYSLLMEYTFTIKHRKGEKMAHVDALSRGPVEDASDTIMECGEKLNVFHISRVDEVDQVQRSDEGLKELIEILSKHVDERNPQEARHVEGYVLDEGRLMRRVMINHEARTLYVMPTCMRKSIVVQYHDCMGHFGLDRTIAHITRNFWFTSMRMYVRRHIQGCMSCLYSKQPGGRAAGYLHPIPPPSRPFERVHIDHLGPFPKTSQNNSYVFLVVDGLTKYVRLFATEGTTARETVRCMQRYIAQFGSPAKIVSDRGTAFTAADFEKYCEENEIDHILIAAHRAQGNGQAERVNRTLLPLLMTAERDEQPWDGELHRVEAQLNSAENKSTGKTPFEMIFGFTPVMGDRRLLRATRRSETTREPREVQQEARAKMVQQQGEAKRRYDARRYEGVKYSVGDVVVIKVPPTATGESTKLQSAYRGPLVVEEVLPADTYKVRTLNEQAGGRLYTTTAHVSQMKLYRNAGEDDPLPQEVYDDTFELEEFDEDEVPEEIDPAEDNATPAPSSRLRRRPQWLQDYFV